MKNKRIKYFLKLIKEKLPVKIKIGQCGCSSHNNEVKACENF